MVTFRSGSDVQVRVRAKLNLYFAVLGKLGDGFHEIETLMAPIDLSDELLFQLEPSGLVTVVCDWATVNVRGSNALLGELPTASGNLAARAVLLLKQRAGVAHGAHIRLIKRIPAASGLGGGSADAAAALVAANIGWELNWSQERLAKVAGELGSDVPFFLHSAWAVCRGRGEQIEPVDRLGVWHAVVVRPPEGLSTAEVYGHCQPGEARPSVDPLLKALRRGDARGMRRFMTNGLQPAAERLSPWIGRVIRELRRVGCTAAQMSGSGSSCFGICHTGRHARRVAAQTKARNVGRVFVVQIGATTRSRPGFPTRQDAFPSGWKA